MFAPSDAVRSIKLPTSPAIKCNALNLSRYWKTGLSAESQPHPQLPWDGAGFLRLTPSSNNGKDSVHCT